MTAATSSSSAEHAHMIKVKSMVMMTPALSKPSPKYTERSVVQFSDLPNEYKVMALMTDRGASATNKRFQPLKVKNTKNANSSFFFFELSIWQKKQKWS